MKTWEKVQASALPHLAAVTETIGGWSSGDLPMDVFLTRCGLRQSIDKLGMGLIGYAAVPWCPECLVV
jgi:hypothetical protein